MAFDLQLLGMKIQRYREQLEFTFEEIADGTGIPTERLKRFEAGGLEPTGDEVLILADFFKCDYRFFVSNERKSVLDSTETLYRLHGGAISKQDRIAIQEFLFLCECEEDLQRMLHRKPSPSFFPEYSGEFFIGHATEVADQLRKHLGLDEKRIRLDIYSDFRKLGVHLFRRRLENSNISGLFIRHPWAGSCVLINYSEDVYRQRFSAAHEIAHTIFDQDQEVEISYFQWKNKDLREIRANRFASNFLMPPDFLRRLPNTSNWDQQQHLRWASELKVSGEALAIGLRNADLITEESCSTLRKTRVPSNLREDPEIPASLSDLQLRRASTLLSMGLSRFYVSLCFDAYDAEAVSTGRLREMLLVSEGELSELADLHRRRVGNVH